MRNLAIPMIALSAGLGLSASSCASADPAVPDRGVAEQVTREQPEAGNVDQQRPGVLRDPVVRADDGIRFLFYQHAVIPLSGGRFGHETRWPEAPVPTVEIACPDWTAEIAFPRHPQTIDDQLICGSSPNATSRAVRLNSRLISSYKMGSSLGRSVWPDTAKFCLRDLFEDAKTVEVLSFYCAANLVQIDIEVLRETRSGRTALAQSTDRVTLELSDDLPDVHLIGLKDNADEMRRQRGRLKVGQDCGTQVLPCSEAERADRLRDYRNTTADRIMGED